MTEFCPGYPPPFDARGRLPGRGESTPAPTSAWSGGRSSTAAASTARRGRWCSGRTRPPTSRSAGASFSSARPDSGFRGLLAKLGITRSYVMVNTFLYSVYGQGRRQPARGRRGDLAYRNAWLDALLVGTDVTAVISLGQLADTAYQAWAATQPSAAGRLHHAAPAILDLTRRAHRGRGEQDPGRDDGDPAGGLERAPAGPARPRDARRDVAGHALRDRLAGRRPRAHPDGGPPAGLAGLVVRPGRLGVADRSRRADQASDDQRRRAETGPALAGPPETTPPEPEG